MKKINFLLIIVIASLLQVTVFNVFNLFGVKPDVFVVLCLIASLIFKQKTALLFSLLIGILKDCLTTNVFGIHVLLFPVICLSLKHIKKNISVDNEYIASFFLMFFILISDIIVVFFVRSYGPHITIPVFMKVFFLESIYSTVLFFFLYKHLKFVR